MTCDQNYRLSGKVKFLFYFSRTSSTIAYGIKITILMTYTIDRRPRMDGIKIIILMTYAIADVRPK